MKVYHFSIIFVIFSFSIMLLTDNYLTERIQVKTNTIDKKYVFDKAVDAAVDELRGYNQDTTELVCDDAVNAFYDSLCAAFDILSSPEAREKLKYYIPVIIISDYEGFYAYYMTDVEKHNNTEMLMCRSEKQYYYIHEKTAPKGYRATDFTIRFSGAEDCVVYDNAGILGGQIVRLNINDTAAVNEYLLNKNYYSILCDKALFDIQRRAVIADRLEGALKYYCNRHNDLALQMGIVYDFSLPEYDGELFLRASDGVSFLAFFQGYPIAGSGELYNCFTIANARVVER